MHFIRVKWIQNIKIQVYIIPEEKITRNTKQTKNGQPPDSNWLFWQFKNVLVVLRPHRLMIGQYVKIGFDRRVKTVAQWKIYKGLRESTELHSFHLLKFVINSTEHSIVKALQIKSNQFNMSISGSPAFSYEEDPIFQKSHYTQDISEQMRVPKRIKATGEYYDDYDLPSMNGNSDHWNYRDKIDMTVPDRIMVIGQEQHLGKLYTYFYSVMIRVLWWCIHVDACHGISPHI